MLMSRSASFEVTRRLVGLAWRYRQPCLTVLLLNGLMVSVGLAGLGLTGIGIDFLRHQVQANSPPPQWLLGLAPPANWTPRQVIGAIAVAILATALLAAVLKYATAIASAELSQRVLIQLRSDVYDKLQRLSFCFFDANPGSSLINRAAGDVQAVRTFVDGVIVKILVVVMTLAVYLVYMFSVHVPLTLACLVTSPLLWYGSVIFSRRVQPEYRRASQRVDDLVLTLVENVQGQHVIKGFARERDEIAKFRQANERVHQQKRSIFWRLSVYQPLTGLLTQLNMLVLIGYGGYLVVDGQLQLGVGMFVFANLLHEFANQVGQITNIANTIQTSLAGAVRVFEVLDAPIEVQSPPAPHALPLLPRAAGEREASDDGQPAMRGRSIRFDGVSFAYPNVARAGAPGGEMVLHDISFEVRPGECLGIVGETGAGKSTLLNLLARFYDVSSGAVLVDGIDVRQLDVNELRRNIGVVFQESFLFSHTVAANIAFGNPAASPQAICRAAHLAAADEFIRELPENFETVVGEFGANLSGGQRQRLAIARALLLDPPILVLDDATASVDPETEHEIRTALARAMRGRTTLVVSNRISALRQADQILVLQKGRIVQRGSPGQLLRRAGPFRRLAELQYADQMGELLAARVEIS
jgi:ATP-binding cassette subfamily B protein